MQHKHKTELMKVFILAQERASKSSIKTGATLGPLVDIVRISFVR